MQPMVQILQWQSADSRAIVRHAVRALAEGKLVAFPTETVYGIAASAMRADAVERLRTCKGRPEDKPLALALRGHAEALDWLPDLGPMGRRLARRCWPGPVTLVSDEGIERGLATRLPETVRRRVCPEGSLGLRVPAHEAIHQVLHELPGPLVLTSANRSGEPDATTAEQVVEAVGDGLDLVVDDGPSEYGQPSTVVRVAGGRWDVLRAGVVPAAEVERLSSCMVLFLCTGNTCRSPLAEGLCKKLLAERLGCAPEELPGRGFIVLSAGLAAMMGGEAAPEAVEAARELGADLTGHRSRPVRADLVAQADHVVAMTRSHLQALDAHFPYAGARVRLLCGNGDDVPDPIGCDQQVYRDCARDILRHLEELVPELVPL
jgi:protein-tyrosine phosphatase